MFTPIKPFTSIYICLLAGGALISAALPSPALTLTLMPDTQSGAPGTTVTFSGILSNTDPADTVYLNSDSFSLVGAGLTLDDTDFALNAPLSLGPSSATSILALFTVSIDGTAVDGSYPGTFIVEGGADSSAQDTLASSDFTVTVAPVVPPPAPPAGTPEPGMPALLAGLSVTGSMLALRRRRA
jgi:hypothetical protein